MEKLAEKLKAKRIEENLSIEEISQITRLTVKHIKALEAGDIDFFSDDLTYMRYFVKSYCDAVNLDFNEVKDELANNIADYKTTNIKTNEIQRKEVKNDVEKHRPLTKVGAKDNNEKKGIEMKIRKVDGSLITMIIAVVVVVAILIFAGVKVVGLFGNNPNSSSGIPTAPLNPDTSTDEGGDSNTKPEPQVKEMEIVKDGVTSYVINNLNEGDVLTIETTFNGTNSSYSVTVNDTTTMQDQIYSIGETATSEVKVEKDMKISLWIGCMVQVDIKVNGKVVKTDDSINPNTWPGTCPSENIVFTIGELNEPAQ